MKQLSGRLPSTTALRVLLAVGERGSASGAAEAIHLSQSAVSKQLLALEALVGQPLFLRTPQGMLPTEAGRIYLEQARIAVKALEDAALRVARLRPDPQVLRLQVLPIFGDRWLLPRFARFTERHPGLDVQFTTFVSPTQSEDADASFRFGEGVWPGEQADYLFGREVALAAAPAYWSQLGGIRALADLQRGVVLEHPQTPLRWSHFAAACPQAPPAPRHSVRFGFYTMVIRAALAGQGMALIPRGLILEELAEGRLENPLGLGYRSSYGYWFSRPLQRRPREALEVFRQWLLGEAAGLGPL